MLRVLMLLKLAPDQFNAQAQCFPNLDLIQEGVQLNERSLGSVGIIGVLLKWHANVFNLVNTSYSTSFMDEVYNGRLFITEKFSKIQFLVDTAAEISVCPRNRKLPQNLLLYAANGTEIISYGQIVLNLILAYVDLLNGTKYLLMFPNQSSVLIS